MRFTLSPDRPVDEDFGAGVGESGRDREADPAVDPLTTARLQLEIDVHDLTRFLSACG